VFEVFSESEPGGTRTHNRPLRSPIVTDSKPLPDKAFPSAAPVGRTTGRTHNTEGAPVDPELAALAAAWPTLPDHIRAAVRAMLGTVTG